MRQKRTHSVRLEEVCIRGWRALAVRSYTQGICRGVMLPREQVSWFVGELGPILDAATGPIPPHIARAWGPLHVLVSPKGVRLWRNPGAWPVEGVGITPAEAPHVIEAVTRDRS